MNATNKLTAADLDRLYPVNQETNSGKWGWRRVNGALNLNACSHPTREDAERDRERANQSDDLGSR